MKRLFILLLLIVCGISLISTTKTKSFIRTTISGSSPTGIAWHLSNPSPNVGVSGGKIKYEINTTGVHGVPFASVKAAIEAAFQTWQNIPTTTVGFTEVAPTGLTTVGNMGHLPLFWVENSTTTSDGLLNVAGAL